MAIIAEWAAGTTSSVPVGHNFHPAKSPEGLRNECRGGYQPPESVGNDRDVSGRILSSPTFPAPDPAMIAMWRAAEGGGPYIYTPTSRFSRRGRPAWRPARPRRHVAIISAWTVKPANGTPVGHNLHPAKHPEGLRNECRGGYQPPAPGGNDRDVSGRILSSPTFPTPTPR